MAVAPRPRRCGRGLLLLLLASMLAVAAAAFVPAAPAALPSSSRASAAGALHAKKPAAAKKGSGKSGGGPATAKGFGAMHKGSGAAGGGEAASASGSSTPPPALIRDKATLALMEWVGKQGGKIDNLGVATVGGGIRGVVALKPFKKGEALLSIPYELALDVTPSAPGGMTSRLGPGDPVLAAEELLRRLDDPAIQSHYAPYLAILPPADGGSADAAVTPLTTTDCFTEAEVEALGWRPIQEETRARVARTEAAAQRSGKTLGEMKWAVWMVVSRSLGVAGPASQRQLLIPFLDLCNHASGSKHILTGRAAPGGLLKVTAGSDVVVGEEVAFAYGGGRLTSDRFLQDYGFLEGDEEASLTWDRRALASALKAGQCSIEELKALASRDDASLSVKGEGVKGALVGEYVRRMGRAARAVLEEEEEGV